MEGRRSYHVLGFHRQSFINTYLLALSRELQIRLKRLQSCKYDGLSNRSPIEFWHLIVNRPCSLEAEGMKSTSFRDRTYTT